MKKKRLTVTILLLVMLIGIFVPGKAEAAETATLRIISTTDLHGQLADVDYDMAGERSVGSLAQALTLIKEAKKEIINGASITVDIGDTIYGYGTDYLIENDENQYMYKAFAKVGYDAITLGNHDFDYGYKYVKEQIAEAGLSDKCVLSNVYNAVTGKTVWKENMIVTKTMKTSKGNKIKVNVGIIGETRPGLTNYYNHTGLLTTKDIIESTEEQVEKLKEKGADVIVVIAHSSIGTKNPEEYAGDVGYALSKVKGVDAVMCGHGHANYPSADAKVQSYYSLPNVSKKTGLMNGKPVIMVADRGAGIGIADLKLTVKNGRISVASSKAKIEYTKSTTKSDPAILKYQAAYDKIIKKSYSEVVGEVEENESINNYFALISDTKAAQLNNEAKIKYGLQYINTEGTDYQEYPVIAASTYKKSGQESSADYIDIQGNISVSDVLGIQPYYHDYAYVYWLTGKQLREWLEWTASAYQTPGKNSDAADPVISKFMSDSGLNPLLKADWTSSWDNFYIFDGIEYEIDISRDARYTYAGKMIDSSNSRITKLTHNGKLISDDAKLILVSDIITASRPVIGSAIYGQRIKKSGLYSTNLLKDYIRLQSKFEKLTNQVDSNWHINVPTGENYLIKSSDLSEELAKHQPWYLDTLETSNGYNYYQAAFVDNSYVDVYGPSVIISPTITTKTHKDIPVIVQATDESGISMLKYVMGTYAADDSIWSSASNMTDRFNASQNGVYTILAMDQKGNRTVKYIEITGIDKGILQAPSVNRVTNKTTSVAGKGESGASVYIETKNKVYSSTVEEDGSFTIPIASQKANSTIKVYLTDSQGRTSEKTSVTVLRSGPNYPTVHPVNNKNTRIFADLNDTNSQIFAIIGETVYVNKDGGKKLYLESTRYEKGYEIVECDYTLNGQEAALTIPVQQSNTKIKVYAIDHIARVNKVTNLVVKEVAPEQPVLYTVCNADIYVSGYIPKNKETEYKVTVHVGDSQFETTADEEGKFRVQVSGLTENASVYATAADVVDDKTRVSAKGKRQISSYERYIVDSDYATIWFNTMDNKTYKISGVSTEFSGTLYIRADGKKYEVEVNEDGTFTVPLEEPLEGGTKIYAVVRNPYGNIIETAFTEVEYALPEIPEVINEIIYDTTRTIKVISPEKCTAAVKAGKKVYTQKNAVYSSKYGGYVYKVKIDKIEPGKTVYIYMENKGGLSKKVKMIVEQKEKEAEKDKTKK